MRRIEPGAAGFFFSRPRKSSNCKLFCRQRRPSNFHLASFAALGNIEPVDLRTGNFNTYVVRLRPVLHISRNLNPRMPSKRQTEMLLAVITTTSCRMTP